MGTQGKLKVEKQGNVTVVSFVDASFLDETSIKSLGDEVEGLVKQSEGINLVVNLTDVDYLSSAVLGRLVKILKLVKKTKGNMSLCGMKNSILQVFKATKLDKMFEIHPDPDKAVRSFKKGGGFRFFWQKK